MATQAVRFNAPSGLTVTLDIFPEGSDIAEQTALTCTEATNKKGFYTTQTFTDTLAGRHHLVIKVGSAVLGTDAVTMENVSTTYDSESVGAAGGGIDVSDVRDAMTAQGYTTARAANLDNLNATISSRQSEADADTRYDALLQEHVDTQALINDLPAASVTAAAVWDALLTGAVTAGTFGVLLKTNLDATISSRESESSAASRASTSATDHGTTQAAIAAIDVVADTKTALTDYGYTAARSPNLDNLDTTVSSREAESAAATRATTNVTEHNTTQTALSGLNITVDEAVIAAAVWDALTSESSTVGSFGVLLRTILDVAISTRQSESSAASRATANTTAHSTTQTAIAGLNIASGVATALDTQGYTTTRAVRLDNLDVTVSSRESEASAASRATADTSEHDATQTAIAALNIPAGVEMGLTNQGFTTSRAAKLDQIDTIPTVGAIADGVWGESLSSHTSSGSAGQVLTLAKDQAAITATNTQT